ncbi:MAG TPA: ADOP family duplicated permease [Gammaproteobacteria bacterium]|nr:ADOP family duplicated permease [Gammaproteobacteria bacterium]
MSIQRWIYRLPLLVRSLFQRERVERELDEELQYHVDSEIERNIGLGMTEVEARAAALRAIGRIDLHKESCRENWAVAAVDRLRDDAKIAARALRRDGTFTAGVCSLLALGIGANVAVFSLVRSVLLEPLPYPDPERLVVVNEVLPESSGAQRSANALHYDEWRKCDCFEDIALAEYVQEVNFSVDAVPERLLRVRVTPNAFSVMGVSAQLGRTFLPEDGNAGSNAAVISDALWRRAFGSNPDILGATITLDGEQSVIVGVLPRGFRDYWNRSPRVDVYRPWGPARLSWWNWNNNYSYTALARIARGVSPEAALDHLNAIQAAIASEHFDAGLTLRGALTPLHELVTGSSRESLLLLLAAVAAAFAVACLNIANLMLARAKVRSREVGIRAALGASRFAIFRGVLVESSILAAAGAAAGVIIAASALAWLRSAAATLPRVEELRIDMPALLAALALTAIATLVIGTLPAIRMTRAAPQESLRVARGAVGDSPRGARFRQSLVVAEVGLTVGLLVAAGLLLTSFVRLNAVDRGFDPTNVLTAQIGLPAATYRDNAAKLAFYDALLADARGRPGARAAGVTSALPLRGRSWGAEAVPAGTDPPVQERLEVDYRYVSAGYLEAIGVRLVAGRTLEPTDMGRKVAVLSAATARALWPEGGAVGRRFYNGAPDDTFEVVGVVSDAYSSSLEADPTPLVYEPLTATFFVFTPVSIAIRTSGEPLAAVAMLRSAVAALDPTLALSRIETMAAIDDAALAARRFQMLLVAAFAAAALLIASLGSYSVLAYSVATRTQEIAMRMALGADQGTIVAMVLRQGLKPVLIGLLAGIAAALALGRFLAGMLYGVEPSDPATLLSVVGVILISALIASWVPAWRAANAPPLEALRDQ